MDTIVNAFLPVKQTPWNVTGFHNVLVSSANEQRNFINVQKQVC